MTKAKVIDKKDLDKLVAKLKDEIKTQKDNLDRTEKTQGYSQPLYERIMAQHNAKKEAFEETIRHINEVFDTRYKDS